MAPIAKTSRLIVAIANQRSTLVFLAADGTPLRSIVPWWELTGMDPATVPRLDRQLFRERTGLPLLPNWWAGKLSRRIHDHRRQAQGLRPATVDTLLVSWLTRGRTYATDLSNAARTGLVDRTSGRRSARLRSFFHLPAKLKLPTIHASAGDYGRLRLEKPAPLAGLNGRIKVVVGDAGAALLGMTGGRRSTLAITLGTGGFLHLPCSARTRPPEGLYLAPAWSTAIKTQWALEAAIPGMARALILGCQSAGLSKNAVESLSPRTPRTSLLAILVPDGCGAIGPEEVRGIWLIGRWKKAHPAERLGALLEGLALLLARAIARFPRRPRNIVVSGGLSQSSYLLQRIADFSGIPVARCSSPDATLHGAAILAAHSIGIPIPPLAADPPIHPRISVTMRRRRTAQFESGVRLTLLHSRKP